MVSRRTLPPGTHDIGPANGSIRVRTTREGVAARVGHDLLIGLTRWSGQLVVDGADRSGARVDVEVEMGSLEVLEGSGGVAPLSPHDRSEITTTALRLLDVDHHPEASFRSTGVTPSDAGGTLAGMLTVRGQREPITLDVTAAGPGAWRGSATVLQSGLGITPYRAFFGALRLADPVIVEVAVDLSGI